MKNYVITSQDAKQFLRGTLDEVTSWIMSNATDMKHEARSSFCQMIRNLEEDETCSVKMLVVTRESAVKCIVGKMIAEVTVDRSGEDMMIKFTDGTSVSIRAIGDDMTYLNIEVDNQAEKVKHF